MHERAGLGRGLRGLRGLRMGVRILVAICGGFAMRCAGIPSLAAWAALVAGTGGGGPLMAQSRVECADAGELEYICGPRNAEDIIRLGGTNWLIASGMSAEEGGRQTGGHLYLLDRESREAALWFPGRDPAMRLDRAMFPDCPGPLDIDGFSAHGLSLRERGQGRYRLYMTSHGTREAIEAFEITGGDDRPAITWVGCVVLPERTSANSVAILSDGGFVTTKMLDPTDPDGFAAIRSGAISGLVYEWHPGGEVAAVPGTELSGPNGIELSPDDRFMYVASFGSREVVRFDRRSRPMAKATVLVPVRPDNLRWSDRGTLYTVGGNFVPSDRCASPPCATGWSVVEVDPATLEAKRVTGADQNAALQGASTALPVGDEIWIGTFQGDRIGVLPQP